MTRFFRSKINKDLDALRDTFSEEELRSIAKHGTIIDVAPGKVLFEEGKPGNELAIVIAGIAKVTRRGILISKLEMGTVVGECAVLTGHVRDASVTAVSMLKISVVAAEGFAAALEESPDFRRRIDTLIQERAA